MKFKIMTWQSYKHPRIGFLIEILSDPSEPDQYLSFRMDVLLWGFWFFILKK
jgi:hypothetical protein